MKVTFSVHSYDQDGDIYEDGIYLHFEGTRIKVADNMEEYNKFVEKIDYMRGEIQEQLNGISRLAK